MPGENADPVEEHKEIASSRGFWVIWIAGSAAAWLVGAVLAWIFSYLAALSIISLLLPAQGAVGIAFLPLLMLSSAAEGAIFGVVAGAVERRLLRGRAQPPRRRWLWAHLIAGLLLYPVVGGFITWTETATSLKAMAFAGALVVILKWRLLQPVAEHAPRLALGSGASLFLILAATLYYQGGTTTRLPGRGPEQNSTSPMFLQNYQGALVLSAADGHGGMALWRSTGISATTTLAANLNSDDLGTTIYNVIQGDGLLFIASRTSGDHAIWRSDGTQEGTWRIAEWDQPGGGTMMPNMAYQDGRLFYTQGQGRGLWLSAAPDWQPLTLNESLRPSYLGTNSAFLGETLYFAAEGGNEGIELWQSNGTPEGTRLVVELQPGDHAAGPSEITRLGERIVFTADDRLHGSELWQSDGSAEGTTLLAQINPDLQPNRGGSAIAGSRPRKLTRIGDLIYFVANDGSHGVELWRTDGTADGTYMVLDLNRGQADGLQSAGSPPLVTAVGDSIYFSANDGEHGFELWRSDGTAQGTHMVKNIAPYATSSDPGWLVAGNAILFFTANDGAHGFELWRSDGTSEGTVMVADIYAVEQTSSSSAYHVMPRELTVVGDILYFIANDGTHGFELWRSDGSAAGTRMVKDFIPGSR